MMKWEYLIVFLLEMSSAKPDIDELDGFGILGWELVSVDNGRAYFKRPLKPKSESELLYQIDSKRESLV